MPEPGLVPLPSELGGTQPHLIIAPAYRDSTTGALYIHQDLQEEIEPWELERHVGPPNLTERFGDIESWCGYVTRYGSPQTTFATWSKAGLRAVLDYHLSTEGPGRCTWKAEVGFSPSRELQAWLTFIATPAPQKALVEFLEDHVEDVVSPDSTELLVLLRSLRATVSSTAETVLNPDGGNSVVFKSDRAIRAGEEKVDLPTQLNLDIPVLAGFPDRFVLYLRMRPLVTNDSHLTLKFTIPNLEVTLEHVYAERVEAAQALLGEGYQLWRERAS